MKIEGYELELKLNDKGQIIEWVGTNQEIARFALDISKETREQKERELKEIQAKQQLEHEQEKERWRLEIEELKKKCGY